MFSYIIDFLEIVFWANITIFGVALTLLCSFGPFVLVVMYIIKKMNVAIEYKRMNPDEERNFLLTWIGAALWFR
jgi:hypothetical protein